MICLNFLVWVWEVKFKAKNILKLLSAASKT